MALFRCEVYPSLTLILAPARKTPDGSRVLKSPIRGKFFKGRLKLDDVKDTDAIQLIRAHPDYDRTIVEIDQKGMEERLKLLGQNDGLKRVCHICGKDDFKSQSGFTRHVIQCKEGKGELSGNAGHGDGAGAGSKERQSPASTGQAGHK